MSSLGQLVPGVVHEINNPVNFIHGNLHHVKEYADNLLSLLQLDQKCYPQSNQELASHIEEIDMAFVSEDLPNRSGETRWRDQMHCSA